MHKPHLCGQILGQNRECGLSMRPFIFEVINECMVLDRKSVVSKSVVLSIDSFLL